ncbi:MAG TPA: ribonuclease III [Phycisphaerales bacterium]|nr:ribonuclease III [Phycisphaerales bacterium]
MLQDDPVAKVEQILGYTFNDPQLMRLALMHASVVDDRIESNERLEFLGDAVLGLITCQRIYELFPNLLEGEMTKIKSVTVSRKTCAKIARQLGLEDLIMLGKGIRGRGGALPHSLAAAALESTIAAVYLDSGLDAVCRWLVPLLDESILRAHSSGHQQNFKSVLQQYAQRQFQTTPEYILIEQKGPDHAKTFRVAVRVGGTTYDPGEGNSKKQAEQRAALLALRALHIVEQHESGIVRFIDHNQPNGSTAPEDQAPAADDRSPSRQAPEG